MARITITTNQGTIVDAMQLDEMPENVTDLLHWLVGSVDAAQVRDDEETTARIHQLEAEGYPTTANC